MGPWIIGGALALFVGALLVVFIVINKIMRLAFKLAIKLTVVFGGILLLIAAGAYLYFSFR